MSSLPTAWVDRVFQKLTLVYGSDFAARWKGLPIADVKTDWAHELGRLRDRPDAIAWALQNLPPDRPPTVLQFRQLCASAPGPVLQALPEPKADPLVVASMLDEIERIKTRVAESQPKSDPREWARKLLARHEGGDRRPSLCGEMARAALGLDRRLPGGDL